MSDEQYTVDTTLDTCGLRCPEPVMMLHKKIREMSSQHTVKIIATDPSTERDIPKFCHFLGHTLLAHNSDGNHFYYWVKKK